MKMFRGTQCLLVEGGPLGTIYNDSNNLLNSGAPNVNFRKISVRKTILDLEFSKLLL